MTPSPFESILVCIPGPWADSAELVSALVRSHGADLLFAGQILLHSPSSTSIRAELEEHNPGMGDSFRIGGQGTLAEEELQAIAEHRTTLYLHIPRPFPETYGQLKYFSDAILEVGGLGVKIENSGTAHSRERWAELIESGSPLHHYTAMVLLLSDDSCYFTCGMHNFNLPDCCISNGEDIQDAAYVMNSFNIYQFTETPTLMDGHTFSPDEESPKYRLTKSDDHIYGDDECFGNPFGRYTLERV